jgi:5-oxopent-3-ene-1,2,5-tricarboxylate decarboxylase/2-hydroxyhepta-2,4-diene-1,7-dioate isomerase
MRWRCRDSFLPIAGQCVAAVEDPDALAMALTIDGRTVFESSTAGMQRGAARLLAEISDFMTLAPGDLLLLGVPHGAPRARVGQQVQIRIVGVGTLGNTLRAQEPA